MTARHKFQPSAYSNYSLMPYGAEEDEVVSSDAEGQTPDVPTVPDPQSEESYSKYAGFARKLLGWDKTKAMEVAVLETRLYALEHGNMAAKLQAQLESGQVSLDQAILKTRELLEVARAEARQETFRNVGFTTLVVAGGIFAFASIGLVGAKVINQIQLARLTQAQIKQIQGR